MSQFLQPSIIILKEGTDTSQGKAQLISNINACMAVVDTIRTTLGPRGMDKLIYEGRNITISNDGATIMKLLDVVHPAARTLVDIARSQDEEVGDGTTSVVVLAGELLKESKAFVEEGVHPTVIIRAFRAACELAKAKIRELAVSIDAGKDAATEMRTVLERCAGTALNSKLIGSHNAFFSKMVVDAVMHLDEDLNIDLIGIKKEKGGSMEDSLLIEGVAFKKCFSYAGFEQQPKKIPNPKILLLNLELELKAEKDNAELRIEDPADYQAMVDAEWNIIYEKLDNIVKSGANVIFSRLAIGDLATQYFADRGVFCGGRVPQEDLERISKATGAQIQTTVNDLNAPILGHAELFEERQVGGERYNFITGCVQARTATIILRGGGEQFIEEAERSMHDAIMIVRRARKHSAVVAGGGAIEMELSKYLRTHSRTIKGKQQLVINAFAKALEVIPRQIADNAGFDSTDILNQLRQKHAQGATWYGVDITNEGVTDTYLSFVWEPSLVKLNSITAATEAACLVLSIDETVKNPKSSASDDVPAPMPRGGRRR
ncbi:Tcomplex protein 1, eta subunit [Acanthamoeba castellanii str. Neff]|jgi:T-complex protein 1 subunit eta|uniref:T-complex protein 1 subunit eta n=1 Tax=Acanthamoeba castellanii (strain ATCC 30010 / Neff) TaxID=1257118 RepID=L8GWE7_ACACF|nr:Tcomplex protein 1, eta subunit [Acanthamoeba castellanii str. Neff]ELR17257.1 Tcomplex protein 1, eta subunit [Acanthamoeba castellanii str. Neff]